MANRLHQWLTVWHIIPTHPAYRLHSFHMFVRLMSVRSPANFASSITTTTHEHTSTSTHSRYGGALYRLTSEHTLSRCCPSRAYNPGYRCSFCPEPIKGYRLWYGKESKW